MDRAVHNARFNVKAKRTVQLCITHPMVFDDRPEAAQRLQEARKARGFETAASAATYFGWNVDTYTQHENGTRGLTRSADRYATAYGVGEGWLLTGEGAGPGSGARVPLVSMISASTLRDQPTITAKDIERTINAGDLPSKGDWIALGVQGDSMDRVAPDGATILVNRAEQGLIPGRFYVFAVDDGAATFKRWMTEPARLQPYSTNPEHPSIAVGDQDFYVVGRARRVLHDI